MLITISLYHIEFPNELISAASPSPPIQGLGTSTPAEGKEYFSNIDRHQIDLVWDCEHDGEYIDLAFNKKRADDRKEWLQSYEVEYSFSLHSFLSMLYSLLPYLPSQPGTYLNQDTPQIPLCDFINLEYILSAKADCERCIPSVVDGLKPSQRKVLFGSFKRNLRSEIKVVQLSGWVSEHAAYHHGEASLQDTIVNMAQNYVGSNNINLLYPSGQFGTRLQVIILSSLLFSSLLFFAIVSIQCLIQLCSFALHLQGGHDAASPRYIFTRLSSITRAIFQPTDDAILKYLDDDGLSIEPEWYMPIIPMALVNGAEGIGTGWSTSIPNYNPQDIIANLKRMIKGEQPEHMLPWYRGFKVINLEKHSYDIESIPFKPVIDVVLSCSFLYLSRARLSRQFTQVGPTKELFVSKYLVFGLRQERIHWKLLNCLLALGLKPTRNCWRS